MNLSRRSFCKGVPAVAVSATSLTPLRWWDRVAAAADLPADGRKLLTIQLAGGNDGLNTLVPAGHDAYRKARPGLAVAEDAVLDVGNGLGLHPRMTGMKELFDAGRLGIVQGVGYPKPNRSHFESMDIWQTAHRSEGRRKVGWLARALASTGREPTGMEAVAVGEGAPPIGLVGEHFSAAAVRPGESFSLPLGEGKGRDARRAAYDRWAAVADGGDALEYVSRTRAAATALAERFESGSDDDGSLGDYPDSSFGRSLRTVARMLAGDFPATVYSVTLEGFDTHAEQKDMHANLVGQLSQALAAFDADLADMGTRDRVCVVAFSEFGRRLRENASLGTDHGAGSCLFTLSPTGKGGLLGAYPSLTDLDEGDLKHTVDFRRVYASLLDDWLGIPSAPVLGGRYEPLPVA